MPNRRHVPVLPLVVLLHLAACASNGIDVSTTFDPLTPFPTQASFTWDDRASTLPTDPRIQRLDLAPLIKEVANEEFGARGYRLATAGSPDYRLSYELAVHTWTGPDNSRSIGSLSLLLVEAASGRRVWMGFGRAEVHVGLTRDERKERLRKAMARMLVKFPPAQRGD